MQDLQSLRTQGEDSESHFHDKGNCFLLRIDTASTTIHAVYEENREKKRKRVTCYEILPVFLFLVYMSLIGMTR